LAIHSGVEEGILKNEANNINKQTEEIFSTNDKRVVAPQSFQIS
jgi:hypothetical protein